MAAVGSSPARAHNLDASAVYVYFDPDTQAMLDARINGGWPPGTPLLQNGDELGIVLKAVPDNGTAVGVGGYSTFYLPNGTQVLDAAYVKPGNDPSDGLGGYDKIPMKGQALMPNVGAGGGPTVSLVGITRGPNILGNSATLVNSLNVNNGTLPGHYGDLGIFYSTAPETAYGTYVGGALTNNSGDIVGARTNLGRALNAWDTWQLAAFGIRATANPTYPATPLIDSNGRGNTVWGLASAVAGPQSGYAWSFNKNIYDACDPTPTTSPMATCIDAATAAMGPWQRIKYPGSQIALDVPGDTTLGKFAGGADASGIGFDLNASDLPATTGQANGTPNAVRWAFGQLQLNVPEYAWIKIRVNDFSAMLDASGCPIIHFDTFGGDAGGDSDGKDHIWRYYDPNGVLLNGCLSVGKPASKEVVAVGEVFQYTARVYNAGNQDLTSVSVTDTLPVGVTFLGAVPAQNSGPNPLVWNVGTLLRGQKFEAVITVKATATGILSNTMTATGTSIAGPITATATEKTYSGSLAILEQSKSVSPTSVAPGGTVQYTLTVRNTGTGATGNPVTVTDNLPAGFTYVSKDSVVVNGANVTASTTVNSSNPNKPIFTVPAAINAGQSLVLKFTALVPASQPAGSYCNSYITNQNLINQATGALACVDVGGGSIGDTVFRDWDGDGTQDPDEEGLPGVTINLYSGACPPMGAPIASQVSSATGSYQFTSLMAGTYCVDAPAPGAGGVPAGYSLTTGNDPTTVVLAANEKRLDVDFGYQPGGGGSVGDLVFDDKGNDGNYNPGLGDVGIPNVTVRLYEDSNANGVIDPGIDALVGTTSTNGSGNYSFGSLATGIRYIADVDQADPDINTYFGGGVILQTTTDPHNVGVLAGSYTAADFGFYKQVPGSIGDQVWFDADKDGVVDAGEPGIPSITVYLYQDTNGDGLLTGVDVLLATASTDGNGNYVFPNLPAGNYIVDVDENDPNLFESYFASRDPIAVTLAPSQVRTDIDFPFVSGLTKTVNVAQANPTDTLTFTVRPYYPGGNLLANVRIFDPLPAGVTYVGGSANAGGVFGAYTPIPGVPGNDPGPPVLDTSISVSPVSVAVGGSVTVTMTTTSSVNLNNVSPGALTVNGGSASCTGPVPASQNLTGGTPANFTWTCTLNDIAEYTFSADASDAPPTTPFPTALSHSVLSHAGGGPNMVTWTAGSNTAAVPGIDVAGGSTTGIYAFQGATTQTFEKYETLTGNWVARANTLAAIAKGGALTVNAAGTKIYGFRGNNTQSFDEYDVASNMWTNKANYGANVTDGGALVFLNVGGTDYVFGLRGNSNNFRRYDIAGNSWAVRANTPANVKQGAALSSDGTYIYALGGNNTTNFWRYDPVANSWASMAAVPANVRAGGGLTRIGNFLYALRGNNSNAFYRYDITANTWSAMANTPGVVNYGGALTTDGTSVFAFQGGTNAFWRYDPATNTWTTLTNFTANTGAGGALVFVPGTGTVNRTNVMSAKGTLVTSGDTVNLTMTLTSAAPVTGVTPSALTITPTGGASALCSGPSPASQNVPANTPTTFTWTCTITSGAGFGSLTFAASATGAGPTTFASATSNSVLVSPVLTFNATVDGPPPTVVVVENTAVLAERSSTIGAIPSNTTQTAIPGSIGDRVWSDVDFDGVEDAGEPGVGGVRVFLDTIANGVFDVGEPNDITDATGAYRIFGLSMGTYTVILDLSTVPPGYYPTTPTTLTRTLPANNSQIDDADFGLSNGTFNVGDTVWLDADEDGVVDLGESGLPNVTVRLYRDVNNDNVVDGGDVLVGTALTNASGNYLFTNVFPGNFLAVVDTASSVTTPFGVMTTIGAAMDLVAGTNPRDVTVVASDVLTADFGFNWGGSIGNYGFYDKNGNGTQGDPEGCADAAAPVTLECGAPNMTVVLYYDVNNDDDIDPGDQIIAVTTSNGTGFYLFDNLYPGEFIVKAEEQQVPAPLSSPNAGQIGRMVGSNGTERPATLAPSQDLLTVDFGFIEAGELEGHVFHDADRNGVFDGTETPIANVTVTLTGTDINGNPVSRTTTTDVDGEYEFIVPPGTYTITYDTSDPDIPAALSDTTTPTSINTTVNAGQEIGGLDFGRDHAGRIGDRVWNDADGDGVQDAGESGLSGITVQLYLDPNGDGNLADATLLESQATGAAGGYLFLGLADNVGAARYVVRVNTATLPASFTQTGDPDEAGTCTVCNSQSVVQISGGASVLNRDFGYRDVTPRTVAGNVFNDNGAGGGTASNGVKDGAEPGVGAGVLITAAVDTNGDLVADFTMTTTTNAAGDYLFTGIPNGSRVVLTVDESTLPSPLFARTNDADGGADATITVPSVNMNIVGQDFGYEERPGSISGTVCLGNGDGQCNPPESGLSGVLVTLTWAGEDDLLGSPDDVTVTLVTDAMGNYSFNGATIDVLNCSVNPCPLDSGLPPGVYQIVETNPPGLESIADADGFDPDSIGVILALGQNRVDQDFEDQATLGDYVWYDTNHDGVQQPEERGIAGVTVRLYDSMAALIDTTFTDGSGFYEFEGLLGGMYTVEFVPPGGYQFTLRDTGGNMGLSDSFDSDPDPNPGPAFGRANVVVSTSEVRLDAGLYIPGVAPARIADRVWYDTDNDGLQDAGEPGLAGVTVTLYDATGTIAIATRITDGSGFYEFAGLAANMYVVEFTPPAGYTISPQNAGGSDSVDSDPNPATGRVSVTLAAGDDVVTVDAGMYVAGANPGRIGDFVWYDTDGDGVQDLGEPGLPGVRVSLYTSLGVLVATDTSAADGSYGFSGLKAGDYYLVFSAPYGYVRSPRYAGGAALDSDIDDTGRTATVNLAAGENDTSVDAGMYVTAQPPISIGDLVWLDLNHNGVPGGSEGLPAAVVVLYDAQGREMTRLVTDANGNYLFTGVAPGDYRVAVDTTSLPPSVVQIADPDATLDHRTDLIGTMGTLAADFGYEPPANTGLVAGLVYIDENNDGNYDPGTDTPLPGVDVVITDANGVPQSVTTRADGSFSAVVVPGSTDVDVDDADLPPGATLTSNAAGEGSDMTTVTVPVNGSARDNTGYVLPPATGLVQGTVFVDQNNDGVYTGGTDTPLAGVEVTVIASNGGVYVLVTSATGYFSQVVPSGMTSVDVVNSTLPPGVTTLATGNTDPTTVNVPVNGTATDNTGYRPAPGTPTNTHTATRTFTNTPPGVSTPTPTATPTPSDATCEPVIKKVHSGVTNPGGELTYSVIWSNPCRDPIPGVVITDRLPNGLTLISADSRDGSVSIDGNTVTVDVGTLPKGPGGRVEIVAEIGTDVVPETVIVNQAVMIDGLGRTFTAEDPVRVRGSVASAGRLLCAIRAQIYSRPGTYIRYVARYKNGSASNSLTLAMPPSDLELQKVFPAPDSSDGSLFSWTSLPQTSGLVKVDTRVSLTAQDGTILMSRATVDDGRGNIAVCEHQSIVRRSERIGVALKGQSKTKPGRTLTLVARYNNVIGNNEMALVLPPEVTLTGSFPAATSQNGQTLTYTNLPVPAGLVKVRAVVNADAASGTALAASVSITDETGDVATATHRASVSASAGGSSSSGGGAESAGLTLTGQKTARVGSLVSYLVRYQNLASDQEVQLVLPEGVVVDSVFPPPSSGAGGSFTWRGIPANGSTKATVQVTAAAAGQTLAAEARIAGSAGAVATKGLTTTVAPLTLGGLGSATLTLSVPRSVTASLTADVVIDHRGLAGPGTLSVSLPPEMIAQLTIPPASVGSDGQVTWSEISKASASYKIRVLIDREAVSGSPLRVFAELIDRSGARVAAIRESSVR